MALIVSKRNAVDDCERTDCQHKHPSHPYAQGSYSKGLLASCCLERRNGLGVCDDHQRVQPPGAFHVVTATS